MPIGEPGPIELTTQGTGLMDDVEVISAIDPRNLEYHWPRTEQTKAVLAFIITLLPYPKPCSLVSPLRKGVRHRLIENEFHQLSIKSLATRQTRLDNSLDFPESLAISYRYPSHISVHRPLRKRSLSVGTTFIRRSEFR